MTEPISSFNCPVCEAPLTANDTGLACEANHSFDRAKEGYVNLLLSHQRKSKQAGDSPEMVQDRIAFFANDHYAPLLDAISATVASDAKTILDVGCGTGEVLQHLRAARPEARCAGIDISKPAIKAAARAYKDIDWAIGNLKRKLPIASESINVLINVMSPRHAEEFARILKPDGTLLMVVPATGHLGALRERLLKDPEPPADKTTRAEQDLASHFTLQDKQTIAFPLALDQAGIGQLIGMTPLTWKSKRDAVNEVKKLTHLKVEARFELLRFMRA